MQNNEWVWVFAYLGGFLPGKGRAMLVHFIEPHAQKRNSRVTKGPKESCAHFFYKYKKDGCRRINGRNDWGTEGSLQPLWQAERWYHQQQVCTIQAEHLPLLLRLRITVELTIGTWTRQWNLWARTRPTTRRGTLWLRTTPTAAAPSTFPSSSLSSQKGSTKCWIMRYTKRDFTMRKKWLSTHKKRKVSVDKWWWFRKFLLKGVCRSTEKV